MAKSKYSYSERKAYNTGKAYAAGYNKKRIPYKSKKKIDSFRAGYKKGMTIIVNYPDTKK